MGRSDHFWHNTGPLNVTWNSAPTYTQSKRTLCNHAASHSVVDRQQVSCMDTYMALMWQRSLHVFGMMQQQGQIISIRCNQQAHNQSPQKSPYIYEPLTTLVWGAEKHTLTIGLMRRSHWSTGMHTPTHVISRKMATAKQLFLLEFSYLGFL